MVLRIARPTTRPTTRTVRRVLGSPVGSEGVRLNESSPLCTWVNSLGEKTTERKTKKEKKRRRERRQFRPPPTLVLHETVLERCDLPFVSSQEILLFGERCAERKIRFCCLIFFQPDTWPTGWWFWQFGSALPPVPFRDSRTCDTKRCRQRRWINWKATSRHFRSASSVWALRSSSNDAGVAQKRG
jgi:hypothetical protein